MENKFKVRRIHTTDANFTVEKVTELYEFKVGDRVETKYGKGEIKHIASVGAIPYAVEHDSFMNNNCCDEYTKHGYGWWHCASEMTLIPKETPAPVPHTKQIIINLEGRTATAELHIDGVLVKSEVSICRVSKPYSPYDAARSALDRLYGSETKLEPSKTVREVKRPAKAGEWIKIVDAREAEGCYSNGDVLCVEEENHICGIYAKTVNTHPCCKGLRKGMSYIGNNEYVVLENYTPPAEPVKPEPKKHEYKVGDLARVVGNTAGHNFPLNTIIRLSNGFDSTGCNAEFLDKSDWWSVHYTDIEPFDGRIKQ